MNYEIRVTNPKKVDTQSAKGIRIACPEREGVTDEFRDGRVAKPAKISTSSVADIYIVITYGCTGGISYA